MTSDGEARLWDTEAIASDLLSSVDPVRAIADTLEDVDTTAEARVHDRWTREVQHRFDTCEARHVDEWRAFAVKMGVVLKP